MLQIYVLATKTGVLGVGPLLSIGISALTTGFASAIIAFDKDIDPKGRKNQPNFYGYIPDSRRSRSRCFILMAIMSTLHNLSRSVGYALLLVLGKATMMSYFVGAEMLLYLVWKLVRNDFMYWIRVEGLFGVFMSLINRIVGKILVDFCGCLHLR